LRPIEWSRTVGFRMFIVEIVDQNEIKVRRRGHLITTQLTQSYDRSFLRTHMTVGGSEVVANRAMHCAYYSVSQTGECLTGLPRRDSSR
jgi:hypothetical protein